MVIIDTNIIIDHLRQSRGAPTIFSAALIKGLSPNAIFAQNELLWHNGQKNFSAYLSGKPQNLFCPFCSNHLILHQKAHLATVP